MERREFYKGKILQSRRDSGLHLLDRLLDEQARADSTRSSNTAAIDAKIRLEELRFEILASSYPSAFTVLRDELANLMLDLPEAERWSSSAIYDYYLRLLASLDDKSLGFEGLTDAAADERVRSRGPWQRCCAETLRALCRGEAPCAHQRAERQPRFALRRIPRHRRWHPQAQQGPREEHKTILPHLRQDPLRISLFPQRGRDVFSCDQLSSVRHASLSQTPRRISPRNGLATAAAQWRPT